MPAEVILHSTRIAGDQSNKPKASSTVYENFHSYALSAIIYTGKQCGANLINPTLMTHGKDITQRYLLCQESTLTDC